MAQQCFLSLKSQKETTSEFAKFCKHVIKMETTKIVNFLNSPENEYSKFETKNGTLLAVNQKAAICITI